MLRFPITDLLDEADCDPYLLPTLHPHGLACPHGHPLPRGQAPHQHDSGAVVSDRCATCHAVFNRFTGTLFSGTHYTCRTLVVFVRGVLQGLTTQLLAAELQCDYGPLLRWRHRRQAQALAVRDDGPLPEGGVETDELCQNAGEKGTTPPPPADPPRRRANKRRGRGTAANDRPPVVGVVGRESGPIRVQVVPASQQQTVQPVVEAATAPSSTVYSDEATSFAQIGRTGRVHLTVQHGAKEGARDANGDGVRAAHDTTLEGIGTGWRNFPRPLRGVHKAYLAQYVVMFEWAYNLGHITSTLLRRLLRPAFTELPR